jgi:hypothetical protein
LFEAPLTVKTEFMVFWVIAPRSVVGGYQCVVDDAHYGKPSIIINVEVKEQIDFISDNDSELQ